MGEWYWNGHYKNVGLRTGLDTSGSEYTPMLGFSGYGNDSSASASIKRSDCYKHVVGSMGI